MQVRWVIGCTLVLGAVSIAACSGDDTNSLSPTPDAGSDATSALNPGEDAGAGDDATSTPDAGPPVNGMPEGADGAASDAIAAGDATDAGDASPPSYALFVGTDFTNAELSVVDLTNDSVAGRMSLADSDSVAYSSGGSGFVLERS